MVAIASGDEHSLALKADGTVVIWGLNKNGQCNVPAGLNDVVAIAGGGYHSLALKEDGTVVAWGQNNKGQCNVPAGLTDVVAIAGGGTHSVALKADGTVVAWGSSGSPEGLTDVVAITGNLGLKEDGTVVALWGDNSSIPGGATDVVAIASGSLHSLALKVDGTVVAWGWNNYGQCNVPAWLTDVVAIAGGDLHSLALKKDGTVVAWGDDTDHQCHVPVGLNLAGELSLSNLSLGEGVLSPAFHSDTLNYTVKVGSNTTAINLCATTTCSDCTLTINGETRVSGVSQTVPIPEDNIITIEVSKNLFTRTYIIETIVDVDVIRTLIASGGYHSLALKDDGTVVAWGRNHYGQCNVPVGLNDVVAIAAGYYHSLALKDDGTVVVWGDNIETQCNVPAGLTDVVAIAGGGYHSLALKDDGAVVAWGNNGYYGQCTIPAGLNDVVAIASGFVHSLALKDDGTVVAWGDNTEVQCNVPAGLTDVVAIAAGIPHSLALKDDGTVVAWGNNGYGECNVPVGLNDVVAIAAGYYHSLALKKDGTVVAWGYNIEAQCNVPAGLTDVVAIAGGYRHSLALKKDGTVVAWGDNTEAQCTVPAGLNLAGRLTGITVNTGALSPVFNKDTLNYSAPINWDTSSVNITANLEYPDNQQLFINGLPCSNGTMTTVYLGGSKTITIEVRIPETGLARTYTLKLSPIAFIDLMSFENQDSTKTVVGAQIHSKLGFNLHQGVNNNLSIALNIPKGLEIFAVDDLYDSNGQKLAISSDKFAITDNEITINAPLQAGNYDLKFVLRINSVFLPISVKSVANQTEGIINSMDVPDVSMEIELVDFLNLI